MCARDLERFMEAERRAAAVAAELALRDAVLARGDAGDAVRRCFYQSPTFGLGLVTEVTRHRFGTGCDIRAITRFVARIHEYSSQSRAEGYPAREAEALIRFLLGEAVFLEGCPQVNEVEIYITVLDALLTQWQPSAAEFDDMAARAKAIVAKGRELFPAADSLDAEWFAHRIHESPFSSWTPAADGTSGEVPP
jgi:hypothetical protein